MIEHTVQDVSKLKVRKHRGKWSAACVNERTNCANHLKGRRKRDRGPTEHAVETKAACMLMEEAMHVVLEVRK